MVGNMISRGTPEYWVVLDELPFFTFSFEPINAGLE